MNFLEKTGTLLNDLSRETIDECARIISSDVIDGNESALYVFLQAKARVEIFTTVMEQIKSLAIDEARLYEKSDSKISYAEFSVVSTGGTRDYKADPEYCRINAMLEARKTLLKSAAINAGKQIIVDAETGEAVPVVPEKSQAGETIKITFNRRPK